MVLLTLNTALQPIWWLTALQKLYLELISRKTENLWAYHKLCGSVSIV